MAGSEDQASDEDILLAQRLISASARHDNEALKVLLKTGSPNVRDPSVGTTPLHAAVASCEKKDEHKTPNGAGTASDNGTTKSSTKVEGEDAAVKTVELLLENGAIWNDLDKNNETPGCIALRLGLTKVYDIMVEAGVRAELLFSKMGELGVGADDHDIEEAEVEAQEDAAGTVAAPEKQVETEEIDDVAANNLTYLNSKLRFNPGILLDSSDNAVMMDWEDTIMKRHAETLLPKAGLRSMNVGHGMGIVDTAMVAKEPSMHHIVEAHPQVQQKLRDEGWHDKKNVRVWEGRWQDVLPKMVEEGIVLDAIYYDTFAEDYEALKEFFSEWCIQLLDQDGRLGWYNGLGADRQICYDVYTKVAEMDLYEAGFDTKWEDIPVPSDLHGSDQWKGTRRPYWALDVYRLPINTFVK